MRGSKFWVYVSPHSLAGSPKLRSWVRSTNNQDTKVGRDSTPSTWFQLRFLLIFAASASQYRFSLLGTVVPSSKRGIYSRVWRLCEGKKSMYRLFSKYMNPLSTPFRFFWSFMAISLTGKEWAKKTHLELAGSLPGAMVMIIWVSSRATNRVLGIHIHWPCSCQPVEDLPQNRHAEGVIVW